MKNLKILLSLLLVLCMTFCLCACGGEKENNESDPKDSEVVEDPAKDTESDTESDTEEEAPVFNVTVVDANGAPVKGVMIQICKDVCVPAMTGDDGVAVFNNLEITDGYKLSVLSCPAGYEYTGEAEVYLESGITEYTVTLNEVA